MKKLKTPEDYGYLYFRIKSKEHQKEIEDRVEAILEKKALLMEEGDRCPKKNEVLIEALEYGLKKIEKSLA